MEPGSFQWHPWQDEIQWTQAETQEVPSKTLFYCEHDWTQVAQGDCGASILGHIQKLSGHGPRQPALGGPAW